MPRVNPFLLIYLCLLLMQQTAFSESYELIVNVDHRQTISLNGQWKTIVDPFETGYYNYRYQVSENGFFKNRKANSPRDLIEYDFDKSLTLSVPGDWNSQRENLFLYEGTVWYKKSFDYDLENGRRLFIYFGGSNYKTHVYLNGTKLGEHEGGFTPFNFEITKQVRAKDNYLIVKVDNKRKRDAVPTLNTDWWNYGGLTRRVMLLETPQTFIRDYFIQLKKGSLRTIEGWVQLDGPDKNQQISLSIPKAQMTTKFQLDKDGRGAFCVEADLTLWSPEHPLLYNVHINTESDQLEDEIGFRSISTKGDRILLNGNPIFLRGISLHEESLLHPGRGHSPKDARELINQAKELGCNFVRLAHYPHNEYMLREADRSGILVWSEIPVYWTILWDNPQTLMNARNQLSEMITRDKNRAAVIVWSVANETPRGPARMKFLSQLISDARSLDATRLITAATEVSHKGKVSIIDDPLGEQLDLIGVNEYYGWYGGRPEDTPEMLWKSKFNKPLVMSEFGGGAKFGLHGDKTERWTEEYQEFLYQQQIVMLKTIPFLRGTSPWILKDFRSPRRPLPAIQDFWNRKGLLSEKGEKKKAWFVLNNFYHELNPLHLTYPFENEIQAFEARDKQSPPAQNSILFIGSSSIRMWKTLERDMAPLKVLNRGFGGSQAEHVLHFLDRIVFPYHPKAIVFYEGDNDIFMHKSPERVVYDYRVFADSVQSRQPGTKIFILSVKPSYNRIDIWPAMQETNRLLQKLCSTKKSLEFIDVSSPMFDVKGQLRKDIFIEDWLHMNAKGYEIWKKVIKEYLVKETL